MRRAIAAGRLDHSLARDEHGEILGIADPGAADKEWRANTRQRVIAGPPTPQPSPVVSLAEYEAETELARALAAYIIRCEPAAVTVENTADIAKRIAAEVGLTDDQTSSMADLFHFALDRMQEGTP